MGNVYEAQNQLRKALGAYKKVLEAAPEDVRLGLLQAAASRLSCF